MSNVTDANTEKDTSWWYIIILFFVFMAIYTLIMNIAIPYLMELNIPFQTEYISMAIAPALTSMLMMLPILLVIFIVQKIRKKPYRKPKKHLFVGAVFFFILILLSKLAPYKIFLFKMLP